ncbi:MULTISPECIES: alpha/beta hydrolase [unclassified Sphingomonas]|uniref:alpha/beta hydrolase n=1 Tax=unclassified Sphingomonas TaxID=196159 RepID=UPI00226A533C|nr:MULTISPECIES: alpha/beta hydrolase [unclassified Sphingomonas]
MARLAPASAPVDGVDLQVERIRSADGAEVTTYTYRPVNAAANGPVMLFTHGGGMIVGSAAGYHATVSAYARDLGLVVISTEYRLAPENPFPAPLDDVHAAYLWLLANAAVLDVDPAKIVVAGDSAGGGLTAALCQRLLDSGDPMPLFQLLIYPMLDDRTTLRPAPANRGQLIWTEKSNLYGWTSYLGRPPVAEAAPDHAVPARRQDLSGLPPAWIGVGKLDLFYDEDIAYAHRLRAAGVACQLDVVEGAFHGFDLFAKTNVARAFRERSLQAIRDAIARTYES